MEKFTWADASNEEAKNNKGKNFFIDGFFVKNDSVKLIKNREKKKSLEKKKAFSLRFSYKTKLILFILENSTHLLLAYFLLIL
jgi:hypothetical protein